MKNHNVVTLLGSVTSNVNYYTKKVKYLFLQIMSEILSCRISSCHTEFIPASFHEKISHGLEKSNDFFVFWVSF
jgi:hypothetical protein